MAIAERDLDRPVERELSRELEQELIQHPGRWVAMTRDRLIAVADSSSEAYEEAIRQGVETPILYRVPDGKSTYFF